MNWSQKLLLIRLGAFAVFVASIIGMFATASSNSGLVFAVFLVVAVLSLIAAFSAKLVAKVVFHWHQAGSVGKGPRVWHD